jgi:hypothetical protein
MFKGSAGAQQAHKSWQEFGRLGFLQQLRHGFQLPEVQFVVRRRREAWQTGEGEEFIPQ